MLKKFDLFAEIKPDKLQGSNKKKETSSREMLKSTNGSNKKIDK